MEEELVNEVEDAEISAPLRAMMRSPMAKYPTNAAPRDGSHCQSLVCVEANTSLDVTPPWFDFVVSSIRLILHGHLSGQEFVENMPESRF